MPNRVSAVDRDPSKDGNNIIQITTEDGATIDAVIDPAAAQILVEILQRRLIVLAHEQAKNLSFPEWEITHVDIVHSGPSAQLMVSTSQMGAVVLKMTDILLRKARSKIDRAIKLRSPSPSTH